MEPLFEHDADLDSRGTDEVAGLLASGGKAMKARALAALARRAKTEAALFDRVVDAVRDPALREMRLMGTISVAHVGYAVLLNAGLVERADELAAIFAAWPEPDRTDLQWFLETQGVQAGPGVRED